VDLRGHVEVNACKARPLERALQTRVYGACLCTKTKK
ncbi:SSU ribosomal protein S27AE / Ubiquitin, partial [Giardia duodenalis]